MTTRDITRLIVLLDIIVVGWAYYMNTVQVRNIEIGTGRPKLCTSIIGRTQEEIIREAKNLRSLPIDIIEWRADWYESLHNQNMLTETVRFLRSTIGDKVLLFTIRTSLEGGEADITTEAYARINQSMIHTGEIDMVDVELFRGDEVIEGIIQDAKEMDVKVVASNHDFQKTPNKEELINRLLAMQNAGADIAKIAVMPQCPRDVLVLLDATCEMQEHHTRTPIVTMSMSGMGSISRMAGEVFGSAITFGAGREASAPGQISVQKLDQVLDILHMND